MENQDITSDQSLSAGESLTLPHFDDEATVQSARPVVPLHEVKRAALTRRHLLLGAALCLAAVVGASIASLIYSHPAERAPEATTATISDSRPTSSDDFITASSEASGATVNPHDAAAPNSETASKNEGDSEPTVTKVVSSNRQPISRTPRVEKRAEQAVTEPEIPERPDQDVRAEDEMLRQQRREARRARRARRAGDGLTRIREIFEGSPRP